MNTWTTDTRRASGIIHTSHIMRCEPGDSPTAAIAALLCKACEVLSREQPAGSWDAMLLCMRPDSGRVIATPGLGGGFSTARRSAAWVAPPDLEARYRALPVVGDDNRVEEFDAAAATLIEGVVTAICTAARLPACVAAFAEVRRSIPVKVFHMEYDDLETIVELEL